MKKILQSIFVAILFFSPLLLSAQILKYNGFLLEKNPTFYVYSDNETENYTSYTFTLASSNLRFAYYNSEHDVDQAFVAIDGESLTTKEDEVLKKGSSSFKLVVNRYNPDAVFETTLKVGVFKEGASSPIHVLNFILFNNKPFRRVFAETSVSNQCPHCVRMHVVFDEMSARFPDSFLSVQIHKNKGSLQDPMHLADYSEAIGVEKVPYMEYDRKVKDVWVRPHASTDSPGVAEKDFLTQMKADLFTGMTAHAYYEDAAMKSFKVEGRIKFYQKKTTGSYRYAVVIKENNVRGTNSDYNQNNGYYAGGGHGQMGGFEKKSSVVSYKDIVYHAVARGILPDYKGKSGMFPSSVVDGGSVKLSMKVNMPASVMKKENVRAVLVVFDERGRAVNSVEMPILTENPVANETIALSEVRVESLKGGVVVSGVAGKKVRVYSVHGYLLDERVMTSDEELIVLPAGPAVVAVEGMTPKKVMVW